MNKHEHNQTDHSINYTEINAHTIDRWVEAGWEWGVPITHEQFIMAKNNEWEVVLTPTKPVPKDWFCEMRGAKVLGLASGGGQQMPIFAALGAHCTVLDYSDLQLESERRIAAQEGYSIEIIKADMIQPLPFANAQFDLIFHPVSNCYIKDVFHVWKECFRILKPGGLLLAGLDNGINFLFDEDETLRTTALPFDPLKNPVQYAECVKYDLGIQFSHSIDEQVGQQLKAGFILLDIFEDTNRSGKLSELNAPTFFATKTMKPKED